MCFSHPETAIKMPAVYSFIEKKPMLFTCTVIIELNKASQGGSYRGISRG